MDWVFDDVLKQRKIDLVSSGYDAYCLYTFKAKEDIIAQELNNNYDYLLATPLIKMSHRSRNGVRFNVQEVLLKNYIFLYVKKGYDTRNVKSSQYYFKVLAKKTDDGKLFGMDLTYANWVLDKEGMIGLSEAIELNGKVKIIKGPLKNMEGYIVKYSKNNRNCLIEIEFLNQKINTWLPFEWADTNY